MKIIKLPKKMNKRIHYKERCDKCGTKVVIDDMLDIIPGPVKLDQDHNEYQTFKFVCPNCSTVNDMSHYARFTKYLKSISYELNDTVIEIGRLTERFLDKSSYHNRNMLSLYRIMRMIASAGVRTDPELMKYKEYEFIHEQMISGELPYEYDDKTYISFTFNARNIRDNITNITTSSNGFIRKYVITWSDGTIMDINCRGVDGEVITSSIRPEYPLYSDRHY